MSLFNQAKRQEQEKYFHRLDYQWGKGLKRVATRPDHMPLRGHDNVANPKRIASVTELPRTSEVKPTCDTGTFLSTPTRERDQAPNSGLHFARGLFGGIALRVVYPEVPFKPCLCALCAPASACMKAYIAPEVPRRPRAFQLRFWGVPVQIW